MQKRAKKRIFVWFFYLFFVNLPPNKQQPIKTKNYEQEIFHCGTLPD